ncbi:zinc finger BED domain-containing protein RICESLEEPER 2-like protein [Tanacetum coccineum]
MKNKMMYKGNNVAGAVMNVPIFVRTFSIVTDFAVLENMDAYRDKGMGDVIVGEPFLREVGIKAKRFRVTPKSPLHMEPGNEEELGVDVDEPVINVDEPVIDVDEPMIDVDEPMINVDEGNDEGNEHNTKTSRLKSFVWKHFTYVKGATKHQCPYCKKWFASGSRTHGTSSMSSHLKFSCPTSPVRVKVTDKKKQSKLSFKPSTLGVSGSTLVTHSFSQEKCRKSIARMCIKDNQPFSIVDDEGFKELVWDLSSEFKMPSRWIVARDCLSLFQEEKIKLKHLLKNQTVCLTIDTWTSVQNYNYMCLTAHWIDEKWNLNKKIRNFCQISYHKGVTIGKLVYRCLQDWGIDRVFTITVDHASFNDGAIKFLKTLLKGPNSVLDCKYLHLRCYTHIINLVMRDGLEEHINSIDKIRNAVRLQVIDHNYRSYFCNKVEDDGEGSTRIRKRKKNDRILGAPEDDDWEYARSIMEYLRIFFSVTKKISESDEELFESDEEDLSKRGQVVKRVKSTLNEFRLKTDIESGFGKYMEKREGMRNIEVDIYVRDGTERRDEKFDVLGWWKQNLEKYLVLSHVARHVLAMPVFTVASESAISTGGRVIDKFRSSLTPKTAEGLICTQDWLWSTPADVEDMQVNGQQLEDLVENLAKIKLDIFFTRKNHVVSLQWTKISTDVRIKKATSK